MLNIENSFDQKIKSIQYEHIGLTDLKLSSIFNSNIIALKIENFLSDENIDKIKYFCSNIPNSYKQFFDKNAGWSYPSTFSLVDFSSNQNYLSFNDNTESINEGNHYLNYELKFKLFNVFKILSGLNTECLKYGNLEICYATIRNLYAGGEGMGLHNGQQLFEIYKHSFYSFLNSDLNLSYGQLGFFITIQNSANEGLLKFYLNNTEQIAVHTKPGDLIIVDEYFTLHEVSNLSSSNDRISFGGFLAYNTLKTKLYAWS